MPLNRFEQASRAARAAAIALACTSCVVTETETPQPAQAQAAQPKANSEDPIDFTALDRLVGDAKLVIFGEDSHRMPAVHQLVGILFRHLVEEKGFRTFVFESYWGIEEVMNAFLASDRPAPNAEETHFLNAFASEATTELLLWARAYNAAHPDDPVRFTGYHPDQPVTDAAALRAFADEATALDRAALESALSECDLAQGKYANDVALLTAHGARRQNKLPAYTAEAKAACLQGLGEVQMTIQAERAALERQTSRAAVKEAELHVSGMRFFVERSSTAADGIMAAMLAGASMERGGEMIADLYFHADKERFEIFEALQQTRDRRGKTFLWMHNWHAARNSQTIDLVHNGALARTVSLGERLSERYGDDLVIIGNVVPCEDCGEPPGSLEPAFATLFGERAALVSFEDRASAGPPVHTPGILFAQYHKTISAWLGNVVLDRHFDAVIYLPNAETLPH